MLDANRGSTTAMDNQNTGTVSIRDGNPPIIVIRNDMDYQRAHLIKEAVAELMRSGASDLHIDCAGLDFVDSSGLSALLHASLTAASKGGRVHLISPPDQLVRVIKKTQMERLFEILNAQPARNICDDDPIPGIWDSRRFIIPPLPAEVSEIRHHAAALATAMGFNGQQVDDIKLAVGEAVSNAVRYGCPSGETDSIIVQFSRSENRLVVEVSDKGCGFDPETALRSSAPHETAEGGRGLHFMKMLMDEVDFSFSGGTTVRMEKYLTQDSCIEKETL